MSEPHPTAPQTPVKTGADPGTTPATPARSTTPEGPFKPPLPEPRGSRPKPAKPRPDFPLFPHAAGVWAKKIRGKLYYFGPWEDPEGALKKNEAEKDDLHAGRKPRPDAEAVTVKDVVNAFLSYKEDLRDAGELSPVADHVRKWLFGEPSPKAPPSGGGDPPPQDEPPVSSDRAGNPKG